MNKIIEIKDQKELEMISGGYCACLMLHMQTVIPTPISAIKLEARCRKTCCIDPGVYYSFKGEIHKCFDNQPDPIISDTNTNRSDVQRLIESGRICGGIASSMMIIDSLL
jgi:hypothetical protein